MAFLSLILPRSSCASTWPHRAHSFVAIDVHGDVDGNVLIVVVGSVQGSVDVLTDRSVSREHFLQTNQLPDWASCDPSARAVSTAERSANVISGLRRLSLPTSTQKTRRRSSSMISFTTKSGESAASNPVSSIPEMPVKQSSPKWTVGRSWSVQKNDFMCQFERFIIPVKFNHRDEFYLYCMYTSIMLSQDIC